MQRMNDVKLYIDDVQNFREVGWNLMEENLVERKKKDNIFFGATDNSRWCFLAPLIISGMSSFLYPSCFIPEGDPTFFISLISS